MPTNVMKLPPKRFCHMCGEWYYPKQGTSGKGFARRHGCFQHAEIETKREYNKQYRRVFNRGLTPGQQAARAEHRQLLAQARAARMKPLLHDTAHTGPGGRPEGTTGIRWRGKEA